MKPNKEMIKSRDDVREIAREEMSKAIIENLDSALIFHYIRHLENRVKELEAKLND